MPPLPTGIAPLDPADKRAPPPLKKLCVRCKERKSAIVLQTAAFCNECFQFSFEGKVRQGLEQSRLCTYLHRTEQEERHGEGRIGSTSSSSSSREAIESQRHGHLPASSSYPCKGRVAIAFSGGAASRAMLHIAKNRLLPSKNGGADASFSSRSGKLQEVHAIDVLYVDDSAVLEGVEDETERVRAIVQEEGGEEAGLFFWPIRLHEVFEDGETVECSAEYASLRYLSKGTTSAESKAESLIALFASIQPSDTPRGTLSNARSRSEDLLALLILHLLRREAIRLGDSCLLTGETSTRMAVRILESVGKGRGDKLPLEEGSIRWNGLFILRPLKEIGAKEVALYSRGKQLQSVAPRGIAAMQLLSNDSREGGNGDKASMARLTESLIHLLERNVPSTVSTVNKVGDKLVFSNDLASHGYREEESEDNDGSGSSSLPFHKVGPSVPLRLRKRQDSASTIMSQMTLNSSKGGRSATGGAGDRSLQGMGLGRLGSTLYFAAKAMIPYHGALACPLCQMPSQRGLHAWKKGLTITSNAQEEEQANSMHEDHINLTELLCYACTMVLETPENAKQGATMGLPSFVLKGAMLRLQKDSLLGEEEASTASTLVNGTSGKQKAGEGRDQHEEKPILHKLDRAQMKQHLNGFLLDDVEGGGGGGDGQDRGERAAAKSVPPRRQTDW